ncbi:MAG: M14 family metallopeptidase, partial [Spirochaetota bacterium]
MKQYIAKTTLLLIFLLLSSCVLWQKKQLYPNRPIAKDKSIVFLQTNSSKPPNFKSIEKVDTRKNTTVWKVKLTSEEKIPKSLTVLNKRQIPFSYYDTTYNARLQKGYRSLEDLRTGYKTNVLNGIYLQALAKQFPQLVHYRVIGKSRQGRKIHAIKIGYTNQKHKVAYLFNGAHHGSELISTEHCYDMIYDLLKNKANNQKIFANLDLWFVPLVNPDGTHNFWFQSVLMGRKNGLLHKEVKDPLSQGVDLNRNYPFHWHSKTPKASSSEKSSAYYRGDKPASEPETQAMIRLAKEHHFLSSISYHSLGTCILFPYTIDNLKNPKPDYVQTLSQKLTASAISLRIKFRKYSSIKKIYSVDGTDQDYLYHEFGTNALLVESSHETPPYDLAKKVTKNFRPGWKRFLDEYFMGYRIEFQLVDSKG